MKKMLNIFIISLLFIVSLTGVHAADSYLSLNGFSFEINDSGEAVICEYDNRTPYMIIPGRLLGAPVAVIDDYAFFADSFITSVSFENAASLKSIGDCAFYGCTGIKQLTLCSSIGELGFGAFQNCTELGTVVIENGLKVIPEQAFFGDTALTSVSIPESVESIGIRAFSGCTSLSRLAIPDSVNEISDNAFDGVSNLVIYCSKDSYAFDFAKANAIDYVITPEFEPATYIFGDVDLNGFVTISDVTKLQRGIAESEPLSEIQIKLADVDGNGADISDATKIQYFLAEYDNPFHIGESVTFTENKLTFIPS